MSSTAGAFDQRLGARSGARFQRQLSAALGYASLFVLLVLSVVMLVRRLGGAFQLPLSGTAIILVAISFELAAYGLRRLFEISSVRSSGLSAQYLVLSTKYLPPLSKRQFQIHLAPLDLLSIVPLLAILLALSIPGTPLWGLLLAWLLIALGETVQRLPNFGLPRTQTALRRAATTAPPPEGEAAEPEIPTGLVQQLTRVVTDGCESVHAIIRAEFAAADRIAIVHVAFCPPLAERPELSAHALDCDDVEIRITQAESFGARLEARLPAASDTPRSLVVEVLGAAKASPNA